MATAHGTATATAPVTISIAAIVAVAKPTSECATQRQKTVGAAATSPPTAGGGTCSYM